MASDFHIRPASCDDLSIIKLIVSRAITEEIIATADEIESLIEGVQQTIERSLDADTGDVRLVAVRNREVIGIILVREYWNLTALFIDPDTMNAGVGQALLNLALDICRPRAPNGEIRLNSSSNAEGFYRRHGFVSNGAPEHRPGGCIPLVYRFEQT